MQKGFNYSIFKNVVITNSLSLSQHTSTCINTFLVSSHVHDFV